MVFVYNKIYCNFNFFFHKWIILSHDLHLIIGHMIDSNKAHIDSEQTPLMARKDDTSKFIKPKFYPTKYFIPFYKYLSIHLK